MKMNFLLMIMLVVAAGAGASSRQTVLDGKAIDLLVGAPDGVVEPLDARRTQIEVSKDKINELLVDDSYDLAVASFEWQDAEAAEVDEADVENVLLDLLSEFDDIELYEFSENFDANSTELIESD